MKKIFKISLVSWFFGCGLGLGECFEILYEGTDCSPLFCCFPWGAGLSESREIDDDELVCALVPSVDAILETQNASDIRGVVEGKTLPDGRTLWESVRRTLGDKVVSDFMDVEVDEVIPCALEELFWQTLSAKGVLDSVKAEWSLKLFCSAHGPHVNTEHLKYAAVVSAAGIVKASKKWQDEGGLPPSAPNPFGRIMLRVCQLSAATVAALENQQDKEALKRSYIEALDKLGGELTNSLSGADRSNSFHCECHAMQLDRRGFDFDYSALKYSNFRLPNRDLYLPTIHSRCKGSIPPVFASLEQQSLVRAVNYALFPIWFDYLNWYDHISKSSETRTTASIDTAFSGPPQ